MASRVARCLGFHRAVQFWGPLSSKKKIQKIPDVCSVWYFLVFRRGTRQKPSGGGGVAGRGCDQRWEPLVASDVGVTSWGGGEAPSMPLSAGQAHCGAVAGLTRASPGPPRPHTSSLTRSAPPDPLPASSASYWPVLLPIFPRPAPLPPTPLCQPCFLSSPPPVSPALPPLPLIKCVWYFF